MSPWVKKMFTDILPRVLLMRRPTYLCRGSCAGDRKKKNMFDEMDNKYVLFNRPIISRISQISI